MPDLPFNPINPMRASEARIERVTDGDRVLRDRNCPTCAPWFYTTDPYVKMGTPFHDPSPRCQQDRQAHCYCDACFT